MKTILQFLLAFGLFGFPLVQAVAAPRVTMASSLQQEEDCDLSSEEVLAIQQALADFLHKQLGEIQAHMAGITIDDCDDNGGAVGTITLSYTGQPNDVFGWVRDGSTLDLILEDL